MYFMNRVIEKTGKTKDIAISEALRELNASREQVEIEILEEEKEGILGIFGARPAKVRVTLKEDKKQLSCELLGNILKYMNIPCSVKIDTSAPAEANSVNLAVEGENVGSIIGKRGVTLNALQYLINVMVNKEGDDKISVEIDASGYRDSRIKSLEELSLKLASKVKTTNKSVELEPMTSQERKIIHMTLKNNTDVYTYSKGEEPFRKVVISAKNKERNYSSNGEGRGNGEKSERNDNRRRYPSRNRNNNGNYNSNRGNNNYNSRKGSGMSPALVSTGTPAMSDSARPAENVAAVENVTNSINN